MGGGTGRGIEFADHAALIWRLRLEFEILTSNKVKYNPILRYSLTCTQDTTFLDYVRGGLKINLSVAVDMTGSNGDPDSPQSLHYIHPRTGENAYTTAIRTVGEILQDYDFGEQW